MRVLISHFPCLAEQGRELQLDKMDVAVATMAGLCHDLGHGPFSHVFDNELLPRRETRMRSRRR